MSMRGSRRRHSERQSKGERNGEEWRGQEGTRMAKMMDKSVEKWGVNNTRPLHVYVMEKKGGILQAHQFI